VNAPIRRVLDDGGTVFGMWAGIASSLPAEFAGAMGYDYVCIDQQHAAIDAADLTAMMQGARAGGAAPLVRVAENQPWLIARALDLGALGVIVPMVDDAEAAGRAVTACRYLPDGRRSFGPVRAGLAVGSSLTADLGSEPLCMVMIETRESLENLEAIAQTPGLDGLYVGPSDLALALGLEPARRLEAPALLEAIERVRLVCESHGLIAGVHCLHGADAARVAEEGFALITVGVDLLFLQSGMAGELADARSRSAEPVEEAPGV
jgi:4-hydroxy-2-oxoheptanedioate aldolase